MPKQTIKFKDPQVHLSRGVFVVCGKEIFDAQARPQLKICAEINFITCRDCLEVELKNCINYLNKVHTRFAGEKAFAKG